jgi:hypothetical protein
MIPNKNKITQYRYITRNPPQKIIEMMALRNGKFVLLNKCTHRESFLFVLTHVDVDMVEIVTYSSVLSSEIYYQRNTMENKQKKTNCCTIQNKNRRNRHI